MKIYTRRGDGGMTALASAKSVSKHAMRVVAYGEVDTLNSHLGLVAALVDDGPIHSLVITLQHQLFTLGAELADASANASRRGFEALQTRDVSTLERAIDSYTSELPPLREFVLPGGSLGAASLHLARACCRGAERAVVALHEEEPVRAEVLAYLNRLSDLLFVLARSVNFRGGTGDVAWRNAEK